MFEVKCKTNLDDYRRCKWPIRMACRPEKGDNVRSECGKTLKIHGIAHAMNTFSGSIGEQHVPYLIIELHT